MIHGKMQVTHFFGHELLAQNSKKKLKSCYITVFLFIKIPLFPPKVLNKSFFSLVPALSREDEFISQEKS